MAANDRPFCSAGARAEAPAPVHRVDTDMPQSGVNSSTYEMAGVDITSITAHWELVRSLNVGGSNGDGSNGRNVERLPSVVGTHGREYWTSQIHLYRSWLVAVQAASQAAAGQGALVT